MILISAIIFAAGLFITLLGIGWSRKAKQESNLENKVTYKTLSKMSAFIVAICIAIAILIPIVVPQYRVWQQQKEGEAELAKAEQNRQIAIQEARAKEESAKSLANAEVIRAQGVAQANKIIGDSLQNNDAYIHYLWIEALRESSNEVIYIPTEAGIPITESTRFFKNTTKE
ncbi:MAG: hypothetical protein IJ728_06205 [Selenomonadaceae bacterium]|nr:hypothetical protein [Selenomonadaceae bacterium]